MRVSTQISIQDALWTKDVGGEPLQPLIIRAGVRDALGNFATLLPNGKPIFNHHLIIFEAIKDDGVSLILNPRPSSTQGSGLLEDLWRHSPVFFTSKLPNVERSASFAFDLDTKGEVLLTGSEITLSSNFGLMDMELAMGMPQRHFFRLTSGFFHSSLSFIVRRFASLYSEDGTSGCVLVPPEEAVSIPIYCDLCGQACHTSDGRRLHWDSCKCQKSNNPSYKT